MALYGAIGQAQAFDGREAGLQAAHIALSKINTATVALGIVIAPYRYEAQQVVSGVGSLLGNVPLIGMSTTSAIANSTTNAQSVVVGVLAGDLRVETHWFPGYAQASLEIGQKLMQLYEYQQNPANAVLAFADGFNGDAEQFCNSIANEKFRVFGGLSSGDLHTGNTYQIAGNQTGTGALTALTFSGNLRMGVGYAHGWDPVGSHMRVTRSRGFWLRTLEARPASETYAELFGYPAREWSFPPLSHMARLYPLGVEQGEDLVIRSPIRVEADGSFRMNASVRDGADAFVLVGSRAHCQKAAQEAAQQALRELNGVKPAFALVLVDISWQMLLKATPGAEIAAIQDIIGEGVPVAGGYTLGQVIPGKEAVSPEFLNQHIMVILFGEEKQK